MPELPEVETVRRGLAPAMVGARFTEVILRRPDLRFPFPAHFAERLRGQEVTALGRRAKYLLADLSSGEVLVMHLGMSGRFLVAMDGKETRPGEFHLDRALGAHDHVAFSFSNGATVTYNDARRFGFMDLVPRSGIETSRHFSQMGIEPLGNELSGESHRAPVRRQAYAAEGSSPRPEPDRGSRQYLCVGGVVPHRAASGGRGRLARDCPRAPDRERPPAGRGDP